MDFSNGKCVARGFGRHKGTELSAKNSYQLFMMMNRQMNAQWESEKKRRKKESPPYPFPLMRKTEIKL